MKPTARRVSALGFSLLGIAAGVVSFRSFGRAFFVLRNDELPWGAVALAAPLLLTPLAAVSAFAPRWGGRGLCVVSVVSAASFVAWGIGPALLFRSLGWCAGIFLLGAALISLAQERGRTREARHDSGEASTG